MKGGLDAHTWLSPLPRGKHPLETVTRVNFAIIRMEFGRCNFGY